MTTIGAYAEGRWFLRDHRTPAPHPFAVAVLAGLMWPLLLIGVVEVGAVVALQKTMRDPEPGIDIYA
ncbi:hypothetical protein [Mycolicibacterium komossense]|uniref:Uncharacterized protein n=1 Tax=Mycolicibacterium komossense TaxID=1779 RepID=A0ABT3CHM4_9MYCO|nr:hypothetical protein [Mycolicibacterium komossense]MCV7228941.1 hypothetical protein [Mycolicibacterium komossense]